MKYLIVGLGNIGPEYHETRHNIGFMAVDALAKTAGATFNDGRYGFTATISVKGRQLVLLKPSTFMNLSGNAVILDAKRKHSIGKRTNSGRRFGVAFWNSTAERKGKRCGT